MRFRHRSKALSLEASCEDDDGALLPQFRGVKSYRSTANNKRIDRCTRILLILLFVAVFLVASTKLSTGFDATTIAMFPRKIDQLWQYLQNRGWIDAIPNFDPTYPLQFPEMRKLQENWEVMGEEVDALFSDESKHAMLGNFADLGKEVWSEPTKWKTVFFKVGGQMMRENYHLAPRTAKLIEDIPNAYLVFFSVLEPNQHIIRHFGSYKGLTKFHLGIRIPNNNDENMCFIRVNPAVNGPSVTSENQNRLEDDANTTTLKYFYKEGESILFDDTYLHDSHNYDLHEPRVILFVDFARPGLPWLFDKINKIFLYVAMKQSFFASWRKNAAHGVKKTVSATLNE